MYIEKSGIFRFFEDFSISLRCYIIGVLKCYYEYLVICMSGIKLSFVLSVFYGGFIGFMVLFVIFFF